MNQLMASFLGASWRTTVAGFAFGVLLYFVELGPNLPTDGHGWLVALMAAGAATWGKMQKDFNVTNATIVSPAAVRPETPPAMKSTLGIP